MNQSDSGQAGYGQYNPNDSADEFNVVSFIIRQVMQRLVTGKLVVVKAVKPGEGTPPKIGTVDVQPLVSMVDGAGNATPHETIYGIPFLRAAGGRGGVVSDPQPGDIGVLVAMDRDSSAVKETWKTSAPGSFRSYDLSDGVYVGGGLGTQALNQYILFDENGVQIADSHGNSIKFDDSGFVLTDKTGNVVKGDATGLVLTPKSGLPATVNGNLVVNGNFQLSGAFESETGSTYNGDLKVAGDVIAGFGGGDAVTLQNHTHQYDRPTGTSSPAQTVKPTAGT